MLCKKCGKENDTNNKFCSACGNLLKPSSNNSPSKQPNNNTSNKALISVGVGLLAVGWITGLCSLAYMNNPSDGWNYHYNGGQETAIGILVFAAFAVVIGICLLIGSNSKHR